MSSSLEVGKILTAQPFMLDKNFKRSVIMITDHDSDDGSIGFILNKRFNMNISELISGFPEIDVPVYFGGPVATDTIHYMHNVGEMLDESRQVVDGVSWGGDYEKLKFLIENKLVQPHNIKFFIGYSGWSPGQLADEMQEGSWVLSEGHANYVFKTKEDDLWKETLTNIGKNYSIIGQMPEANNLN